MDDRPKILIDMDGVLANLLSSWLKFIEKDFDEKLTINDITSFDITSCSKHGMDVYRFLMEPGCFFDLEPIHGAIEGMKQLHNEGYSLYIATVSPPTSSFVYEEKHLWIEKHLPFFSLKNLIFCRDKGMLRGEVLFDDGPHNIEAFKGMGVVLDYPYNRNVEAERVTRWDEFISLLHKKFPPGTKVLD